MRVGKRSGETDLARNSRPDHGFLIRIGRSAKPYNHQQNPERLDNEEPFLGRETKVDSGFMTRVGEADKPFLIRVGRSSGTSPQTPAIQDKRQKSGSKAFFLPDKGWRAATNRKAYFTRVGRLVKGQRN